jgi:hypothetical protein
MALKLRVKFDGKCARHPRYSPARDGQPTREEGADCRGCDDLYVIWLYSKIIQQRVVNSQQLVSGDPKFIIPGAIDEDGVISAPKEVTINELVTLKSKEKDKHLHDKVSRRRRNTDKG